MNNYKTKKILKVTLFTSLVLGSIGLTLYPDTNSRFIKNSDDETVLKFNSSINNLYGGSTELNHEQNSTGENLYLKLNFNRNEILRPVTNTEKTDTYFIEVPKYCLVYNNDVDSTMGSTVLVLNNDMKRDINVEIDCIPESIANNTGGKVTVPIKVYEKFSNEEKFIYWKFDYFGGTLDEYYDKVGYDPNPPVGEDPILPPGYVRTEGTLDTVFSEFQNYFNNIVASGTETLESINDYIYPLDLSNKDSFIKSIPLAKLVGLDIILYEPTETREKYIVDFRFDPNFLGYVESKRQHRNGTFYFSATEEDDVRNALKVYLDNYYTDSKENATSVYDYIVKRSGGNVKGFIYENTDPKPKSITRVEPNGITLNSYTVPIALNFNTPNVIKLDYTLDMGYKWRVFIYSLYASDIISAKTVEDLQVGANNKELRTSVTKNSTAGSYTAFTDYFIYDNSNYDADGNIIGNKKYLLIKVTSDPDVGNYNLVTLESLESDLDITFSSNATNNTLDIQVVYKENASEVDAIKERLATYFNLVLDDTNSTITEDETTKTVTISINKDKILEAAKTNEPSSDDVESKEEATPIIPESEIINNMQVKFLNNKPLEGVVSNPLIEKELDTKETKSCPIEAGVQIPCIELPLTDGKENNFKDETKIIEEEGITA